MKTGLRIALSLYWLLPLLAAAQDPVLVLDKPGTFKVVTWSVYTLSGSDFTKKESGDHYKNMVAIAEAVRKNPVLADIKGFDCQVLLYGSTYDPRFSYGIPCDMSFQFCHFYRNKAGKIYSDCIEPDHWDIQVNQLGAGSGASFGFSGFQPTDPPKKGFNYQAWKRAAEKTRGIIAFPGAKETLAPGIDRYNKDRIILYNPERPPYWVPVTIGEAFTVTIEYWRLFPDSIQSEMMTQMLEKEYAQFSEAERKEQAYTISGDLRSPLANFGIKKQTNALPLVRWNPEYWNRQLPRSAVQLMSFICPEDKTYIRKSMEEALKHNGRSYHLLRFEEGMGEGFVRGLGEYIGK